MKKTDGYKRIGFLTLCLVALWLKALGVEDSYIQRFLESKPELAPFPPGLIVVTVGSVYAIINGIQKALAEKRAKQDSIETIRRFM